MNATMQYTNSNTCYYDCCATEHDLFDTGNMPSTSLGYPAFVQEIDGAYVDVDDVRSTVNGEKRIAYFWWEKYAECERDCGCGGHVRPQYTWVAPSGGSRCNHRDDSCAHHRMMWSCSACGEDIGCCRCQHVGLWPFTPSDKCC